MGWTYTQGNWTTGATVPVTDAEIDAYCRELFESPSCDCGALDGCDGRGNRIEVSAVVGNVWYGALNAYFATTLNRRLTMCMVVLLDRPATKTGRLGFKIMDECMHPYSYTCPPDVLAALTEPATPEAARWRAAQIGAADVTTTSAGR
jgi:hypothetical protein